ncbi:MAG: CoA transferase [Gemmatimonadetes bacterium]|nr:CoA transferase [Gemmatimonadota bacterium]
MSHLPLKGLRVLDLTRVLAGPIATMQLGDLGAHVIKVERPGTGDESRGWGPPWDSRGESAYFLCCNRNKLGVAADLSVPGDAAFVRSLAAKADVVVDNFMPGALARRGLEPAAILSDHPELVWCTITGFGSDPTRPGYDYVIQAESGWMSVTGEPDGEPTKMGIALADILTGKEATAQILATLTAVRAKLPVERHVHVALFETAVAALTNVAQNALVSGSQPQRWGNAHANLVPYELFSALDRPIVIAVGNDAQYVAFVRVVGVDELSSPEFGTNAGRVAHRARVVGLIRDRIAERPAATWIDALREAGVPAGAVNTVEDALRQVHASALTGVGPQPPGAVLRPPPRLDEHGGLVRAHGWDAFSHAADAGG